MKLATMFFADTADTRSEVLNVTGGLWDGIAVTAFPASHEILVVLLVRPEVEDLDVPQHVDLTVLSADGTKVGHSHVDLAITQHKAQIAVVLPVRGGFDEAGTYSVRVEAPFGTMEESFRVVHVDAELAQAAKPA